MKKLKEEEWVGVGGGLQLAGSREVNLQLTGFSVSVSALLQEGIGR